MISLKTMSKRAPNMYAIPIFVTFVSIGLVIWRFERDGEGITMINEMKMRVPMTEARRMTLIC